MEWNKPPNKSPWDKNNPTPDIDELLNNLQGKFKFGMPQKNLSLLILVVLAVFWLATGIFIVDPQEQAVIKRFGEVHDIVGPGPHYHLPSPIETVQIEQVTSVRRIEIGFRTIDPGPPAKYRQVKKESLMLTGDENIVDVQFTVQYKIAQIEDYLYNLTNPDETVKSAAESAMREVIGDTTVTGALTVGKAKIESDTANLLQETLKGYNSGLLIGNVKLQDVHPPDQVKEAFKDVVSAREDREKLITSLKGILKTSTASQKTEGSKLRRLNRFQYNNAVKDLFKLNRDVFNLQEKLMTRHDNYIMEKKMPETVNVSCLSLRPEGGTVSYTHLTLPTNREV